MYSYTIRDVVEIRISMFCAFGLLSMPRESISRESSSRCRRHRAYAEVNSVRKEEKRKMVVSQNCERLKH